MALVLNKPVLQKLNDRIFAEKELTVYVLRDDLIHPYISGNKWRKLKYNIMEFQKQDKEVLVTFGGAYSNHLVATAAAGKEFGINTIGIIRGEEHTPDSNPVLRFAHQCGMRLIFVSRENYRSLRDNNSAVVSELHAPDHRLFILPEGGSNELAVAGCKEIIIDIIVDFDFICCACGTGTTLAGISSGLNENQKAIGVSVLHGEQFLEEDIFQMNGGIRNFLLTHDYHFSGYAKTTKELDSFCKSFSVQTNIPVEPVYTGKLFYGLYDLIQNNFFETGKTIVAIHTGGIFDFKEAI